MDNPFPGMDPWMEKRWSDAHHTIITFAREQLRPQLPSDLLARVEERFFIETNNGERHVIPDVHEAERPLVRETAPATRAMAGVMATEPLVVRLVEDDPTTQGYIEIAEKNGRVITHLEVLSPANKKGGAGRRQYLDKQSECIDAGVNFVEIDLIRSGQWTVLAPISLVPGPEVAPYRASVWRAAQPELVEFYAAQLRKPLPIISVPLRLDDIDVLLDLQSLVNQAYVSGSYESTDYNEDPVPALSVEDSAWACEILKSKALRN